MDVSLRARGALARLSRRPSPGRRVLPLAAGLALVFLLMVLGAERTAVNRQMEDIHTTVVDETEHRVSLMRSRVESAEERLRTAAEAESRPWDTKAVQAAASAAAAHSRISGELRDAEAQAEASAATIPESPVPSPLVSTPEPSAAPVTPTINPTTLSGDAAGAVSSVEPTYTAVPLEATTATSSVGSAVVPSDTTTPTIEPTMEPTHAVAPSSDAEAAVTPTSQV